MRTTFLLFSAILALAACTNPRPPAPPPVARPPVPKALELVARDVTLRDARSGAQVHVTEGRVLFRSADQFVRLSAAGETIEGYLTDSGSGIGAYVQREVRFSAADGAGLVDGRLHPGAFVGVVAVHGDRVEVSLPPFHRTLRIPVDVLGASRHVQGEHLTSSRTVENRRIGLAPSSGASTDVALHTSCAPVDVETVADGRLLVTQNVDGIEITGVAHGRGERCAARQVVAAENAPPATIPAGWSRVPGGARSDVFDSSRKLYWLVGETPEQLACVEWAFERRGEAAVFVHRTVEEYAGGAAILETTFGTYGVPRTIEIPSALTLLGPSSEVKHVRGAPPPFGGIGMACGQPYLVVGTSGDGLVVLPGVLPGLQRSVVAYHPDDAEVWYTTKLACERTVTARQSGGSRRLAAWAIGTHEGC